MKTKLSFLALPPCLGLALIFALAACGGGGGSGDGDSSSSGGNSGNLSSQETDAQLIFDVDDPPNDIYPNLGSDKIELLGSFNAGSLDPIVKLEFFPSGVVSYNGNIVNSAITSNLPNSGTFISLTNQDTYVDLKKVTGCGQKEVDVRACLADKDGKTNRCTSYKYKYERPDSYCATSSSGGGGARSSSSEAMWKFGQKQGPLSVQKNTETEIPGFSVKFTLKDPAGDVGVGVDISISGGKIRWTEASYNAESDKSGFTGEYPEPNHAYPNSIFRSMTGPSENMSIPNLDEYHLLTANSGNDKYLIRIEPRDGPGQSPGDWPKKVYYWKVEDGPNL